MGLSSYHVHGSFDKKKRKEIVARVVKELRDVDFDALAVRGVSGLILAPIVAYLLDKYVIVVRKPSVNSHASESVESPITAGKYVIFDDFVSSGATARAIKEEIDKNYPSLVCVGGYVWLAKRCFDQVGTRDMKVKDLNAGKK